MGNGDIVIQKKNYLSKKSTTGQLESLCPSDSLSVDGIPLQQIWLVHFEDLLPCQPEGR